MDKKMVIIGPVMLAVAVFIVIAPWAEATVHYKEVLWLDSVEYAYTFDSNAADMEGVSILLPYAFFAYSEVSMQNCGDLDTSAVLSFEKEPELDPTFTQGLNVKSGEVELTQYAGYTALPCSAALGMTIEGLEADFFSINASVESPILNTQLKFFGESTSRSWDVSTAALYEDREISTGYEIDSRAIVP